jgi:hypothetical protein
MTMRWGTLGFVAVMAGCVKPGAEAPAHALYDDPSTRPSEAATLIGDVLTIDGKRVAEHGNRFLLEAGCHTVTNVTTWGGSSSDENGVVQREFKPNTTC